MFKIINVSVTDSIDKTVTFDVIQKYYKTLVTEKVNGNRIQYMIRFPLGWEYVLT
jgi:hypothetical protein